MKIRCTRCGGFTDSMSSYVHSQHPGIFCRSCFEILEKGGTTPKPDPNAAWNQRCYGTDQHRWGMVKEPASTPDPQVCTQCKGSKRYVGLNKAEDCKYCGATGIEPTLTFRGVPIITSKEIPDDKVYVMFNGRICSVAEVKDILSKSP